MEQETQQQIDSLKQDMQNLRRDVSSVGENVPKMNRYIAPETEALIRELAHDEVSTGESNTVTNIGGGSEIYKEKIGVNFKLRSIIGTAPIVATQNANDVTVSLTNPLPIGNGGTNATTAAAALTALGGVSSPVGITDLADGTDGELITWDTTGSPATVGVGTSGQILTSNGAGASPTFQSSGSASIKVETSATAGQKLLKADAVMIAASAGLILQPQTITDDSSNSQEFGRVATNAVKIAQKVTGDGSSVSRLKIYLKKIGTPTNTITITIQGDSAGEPDGTPLGTDTLAASSLTTSFVQKTLDLDNIVALDSGSDFWIVLETNTTNDTDYLDIQGGSANSTLYKYNGSGWSASGIEGRIKLELISVSGNMYKASAVDADNSDGYVGFISANVNEGSTASGLVVTVIDGLSSLTSNETYYLSDTHGEVSLTKGTIPLVVGESLSTTEILVHKNKYVFLIYEASDTLQASADTERQISSNVYYKIKEIQVFRRGVIRVKFDIQGNTNGTAAGKVYINGVAVGVEGTTTADSDYHTYTEDFTVLPNDKIQLYVSAAQGYTPRNTRNFRLYWDLTEGNDYVVNTD